MTFLEKILDALAPGWVGSLIGITGIVAAVATYLLTRRRMIIAYRTRGAQLLGTVEAELPSEVTVHYRGKDVPRLTRSIVVFWNDGERTINYADVVHSDPLRLDAGDGAEILSTSLVKSSRDVIQLGCHANPNCPHEALLSFEFLDAKDGGVIEILHTGKRRHLKLLGTVRGMPNGPKSLGSFLSRRPAVKQIPVLKSRRALAGLVVAIGIAIAMVGFINPIQNFTHSAKELSGFRYFLVVVGLLYAGIGVYLLWLVRRRYPRGLHAEELE